jgi:hypothetical protein
MLFIVTVPASDVSPSLYFCKDSLAEAISDACGYRRLNQKGVAISDGRGNRITFECSDE